MYICRWTSEYCLGFPRGESGGWGEFGPVVGVAAALEFWDEAKLAGWKRGSDGSLKFAAVPDEDWRAWTGGLLRRACEGMASDSTPILGDSGGGILRSGRGDMERW
jgi:hypothetical protein